MMEPWQVWQEAYRQGRDDAMDGWCKELTIDRVLKELAEMGAPNEPEYVEAYRDGYNTGWRQEVEWQEKLTGKPMYAKTY